MASYCGVIHRMRYTFDPLIGDYYEWNHNGEIHCFHEDTIEELLWPDFKDWFEANYEEKNNQNDLTIWENAKEKYWNKFLIDEEPFIIELFDDLAHDTEITLGHDSKKYEEIEGLSVEYHSDFGYIYDNFI